MSRTWLRRLGPFLGLLAVWGLFGVLLGGDFARWDNQRLMLLQTAVVGTAAVGATLVIVSGGIDLSVGSSIALGTVVIALLQNAGAPPLFAAVGGIGAGMLIGVAIGAMVIGRVVRVAAVAFAFATAMWAWSSVGPWAACGIGVVALAAGLAVARTAPRPVPLSPFIVTLAMWGALRGAAKGLGGNQPVYPRERTWLNELMANRPDEGFLVSPAVWMLLALAVLAAAALRYTRFGRHVFAIGSNEETARLCGVPVERTKVLVYTIAVGCAGLAGLLQFAFLSMGDPTTAEGYELKVIAAVVIGGASLSGGEGSILGTLVGALIMTIVDNGCTKLGLDNWVQDIVTGAIIVVAVVVDRLRTGTR